MSDILFERKVFIDIKLKQNIKTTIKHKILARARHSTLDLSHRSLECYLSAAETT